MNGGESGNEEKKTLRLKLHWIRSVSTSLCLHESLVSRLLISS